MFNKFCNSLNKTKNIGPGPKLDGNVCSFVLIKNGPQLFTFVFI